MHLPSVSPVSSPVSASMPACLAVGGVGGGGGRGGGGGGGGGGGCVMGSSALSPAPLVAGVGGGGMPGRCFALAGGDAGFFCPCAVVLCLASFSFLALSWAVIWQQINQESQGYQK
jgi:hypothetical protein